jgi:O-antigen/teichoic acid export membrane protein
LTGTESSSVSVPVLEEPTAESPGHDAADLAGIARGSKLNLAGAAVFGGATLGVTVVVAREFTRSAAGAFFTATSLFLLLEAIAGLGAYSGLVYFIARLRSHGADDEIPTVLRAAVVPVVVVSIATASLLIAFASPLAEVLSGQSVDRATSPTEISAALRALAVALPFAALLDTLLGGTRGYRDMRPTVALDRIGRSCLQLLGALSVALTGTVALLAPLWALPYIPCAAAAWIWLRRIRRRSRPSAASRADDIVTDVSRRAFWNFTAPRAVATVAQIVIQRLDIVLVAIIRGPVAAAIYTAATRFIVIGQLGNMAIGQASQPQLSHLFALNDRRGANTVYQTTTAWLVILLWPVYLLAIVYGPEILSVFGAAYRAGSTVTVILGCSMLVGIACGQVDVVLVCTGRSALSLANGLVAVAVNVGVDLVLIPRYGITGAAIGWGAAIVAANLIPLVELMRIVRVHPFGAGTLLACAMSALSFGVLPLFARSLFGGGPAPSIIAVAAGCATFAASLWWWREPLRLSMLRRAPRPRAWPPTPMPRRP